MIRRSFIDGNGWLGSLGVSSKDGGVNTDLNCLFKISLFDELSVYCIQDTVTSKSSYTKMFLLLRPHILPDSSPVVKMVCKKLVSALLRLHFTSISIAL